MDNPSRDLGPAGPLARALDAAVRAAGGRAYLVGGCVRDRLRGASVKDLDIEVFGIDATTLRDRLAALGRVDEVGRDFAVLKLTRDGQTIDVALPRRERKHGPGHRGFEVAADPHLDLATAASRRDLTINAILEDLADGAIVDPWNGRADLAAGVLRHVSPAFTEDPLRVLRVVQFAARFAFSVAPETAALCRTLPLRELAVERIADEIEKWLLAPFPGRGLRALIETGAHALVPELGFTGADPTDPVNRDRFERLSARLDRAARLIIDYRPGLPLMLATLFAPATNTPFDDAAIATRLGCITKAIDVRERTRAIGREWTFTRSLAADPNASALRRLALRAPLQAMWRALAIDGDTSGGDRLRNRARELGILDDPPRPFLQGRDLLALGATPGRSLGELLQRLFEQQLDGLLPTRDAALARARELLDPGSGLQTPPRPN